MWRAYSVKRAQHQQQRKYWQDHRARCKNKRQDNFNKSLKILQDANIDFIVNDNKECVILTTKGEILFYPTTGTFTGTYEGRGVFDLIQKINA